MRELPDRIYVTQADKTVYLDKNNLVDTSHWDFFTDYGAD